MAKKVGDAIGQDPCLNSFYKALSTKHALKPEEKLNRLNQAVYLVATLAVDGLAAYFLYRLAPGYKNLAIGFGVTGLVLGTGIGIVVIAGKSQGRGALCDDSKKCSVRNNKYILPFLSHMIFLAGITVLFYRYVPGLSAAYSSFALGFLAGHYSVQALGGMSGVALGEDGETAEIYLVRNAYDGDRTEPGDADGLALAQDGSDLEEDRPPPPTIYDPYLGEDGVIHYPDLLG